MERFSSVFQPLNTSGQQELTAYFTFFCIFRSYLTTAFCFAFHLFIFRNAFVWLRTTLACTGVVESGVKALVVYRQPSEPEVESGVMGWERVATVATASSQATDLANCMLLELPLAEQSVIIAAYRYHSQPFQNGTWGRYTIMTQRSFDGVVSANVVL